MSNSYRSDTVAEDRRAVHLWRSGRSISTTSIGGGAGEKEQGMIPKKSAHNGFRMYRTDNELSQITSSKSPVPVEENKNKTGHRLNLTKEREGSNRPASASSSPTSTSMSIPVPIKGKRIDDSAGASISPAKSPSKLTFSSMFTFFKQSSSSYFKSQVNIADEGSDETLMSPSLSESYLNGKQRFSSTNLPSSVTSSKSSVYQSSNLVSRNSASTPSIRKSTNSEIYQIPERNEEHASLEDLLEELELQVAASEIGRGAESSGTGLSITTKLITKSSVQLSQHTRSSITSSTTSNESTRRISRSLSREFENSIRFNRSERRTSADSSGEHGRCHTRHIVETSHIYTRKEKGDALVSPSGEVELSQGQINQFHLLETIGDGSFGRVVRAFDEVTRTYFACKIISKSRLLKKFRFLPGNTEDKIRKMKQEVAVLKKVSNHPKIIKLHEVLDDKEDENVYLFFELCERGPVMELQSGLIVSAYDEERARVIFRDVVLGLEFLHYKGIIHCDLKPDNILLTANGEARIGDFGISTILDNASIDTIENQNTSPLFTSPCALSSEKGVINGRAADIWALGVTLYSLVHGYCPFEDDNIVELYEKIQRDRPVYKETISHLLKDLLDAMLNKNSLKRISLEKLKSHPWVEGGGLGPLPSKEENCFEVATTISKEEIEQVFKPATFVHKMMHSLLGGMRRASLKTSS